MARAKSNTAATAANAISVACKFFIDWLVFTFITGRGGFLIRLFGIVFFWIVCHRIKLKFQFLKRDSSAKRFILFDFKNEEISMV